MRQKNIAMLNETLDILDRGWYMAGSQKVPVKLTREQMEEARVFLPRELEGLFSENASSGFEDSDTQVQAEDVKPAKPGKRCSYSCVNEDSFQAALKRQKSAANGEMPVLVLNLANPFNPGGGVRNGARAQEEDLCRKSSLLLSLEGRKAMPYYDYNNSANTAMGTDALIIHPYVEVIRDEKGEFLPESVVVAVLTCAAPILRGGLGRMSMEAYEQLMLGRITGMLKAAAFCGYRKLVLGAFGCGAFNNDARIVSDLFYRALKELELDGKKERELFDSIDFAVMDRSEEQYNFTEFARNFTDFYRDEDAPERARIAALKEQKAVHLDAIRGCLFGGGAGDTLGYPVEFMGEKEIFSRYGKTGITAYETDKRSGKALISDDTQMVLFTAAGLLEADTAHALKGDSSAPRKYVALAYQDWLKTQQSTITKVTRAERGTAAGGSTWLLDVPELYARRAPGNTCLDALEREAEGETFADFVEAKRNNSKGCGGIMRVAPMAALPLGIKHLDMEAAQIAAITHGHPLGYMPAAVLVHILNRIIYPPAGRPMTLKEIVLEARDTAEILFAGDPYLSELVRIIDLAVELADDGTSDDLENIHLLGEGWVAEETLGISLYCALRYADDFSAGLIASVNHKGDSDSTGAVTGNILGALHGYSGIPEIWKKDLELSDVILELSDDLCYGCLMTPESFWRDPAWETKYMQHRRPEKKKKMVFFWMDNEENGGFSNWYRRKFVYDDFEYQHVEQYMMAQKAKLFHDSTRYTAILRADEPADCKALGRQVKPFDGAVWNEKKYEIVKTGVREKFAQNPDLLAALLETGDAILAEASPKDTIWGIGLGAKAADVTHMADWPGENLMGKILMDLREEFAAARRK